MSNQLAEIKKNTVDVVTQKIKSLESNGEIQFPPDYSPQNALRSAWLQLQEIKTKDKKPVLEACSKTSIMNALFDMTVQGLNPAKNQVYFIPYGQQLTCMRSYHGTKALAMRVDEDIGDIVAEVVWEGDEFEFEIDRGMKKVVRHKQTLESIDSKSPKGAYCLVLDHKGNVKKSEIMTWEQIKSAWKKSIMNPIQENGQIKSNSTHGEFTEEMCKRTVINRACKPIINSSSDAHLFKAANRSEQVQAEQEAEQVAEANANQEVIDVEPAEAEPQEQESTEQDQVNEETGEVQQEQSQKNEQATGTEGPEF